MFNLLVLLEIIINFALQSNSIALSANVYPAKLDKGYTEPESIFFMAKQNSNINVAVLVDGGFFLKRYKAICGKHNYLPEKAAAAINNLAHEHLEDGNYLYRIFYYDCAPFDKKIHHPLTKKIIDFKKTQEYSFRTQLFEELKKKRKVALRLGTIKDNGTWAIYPIALDKLFKGKIQYQNLNENDIFYNMRQKGIDMKIGVDIASLAFKKLVHKIVLIAGDSDFVPASKLARREGIDFVLDPMWNNIDATLFEHIDGLKSTIRNPKKGKQSIVKTKPSSNNGMC